MGKNDDRAREATECAWGVFLDTLLLGLGSLGEGDVLALVSPAGAEGWSQQIVCRADPDNGYVWATRGIAGSTAAEAMVASGGAHAVAGAVVRVAREELRLPHPQLFTARPAGRGAVDVAGRLGLTDADAVTEPGLRATGMVRGAPDALRPMVMEVAARVLGRPPEVDDDGDAHVDVSGTRVYVLIRPDGGMVEVFTRVVRGVYSRRNTAVEVDLLNRRNWWSTWYLTGRDVYQKILLPARPLSADNLGAALTAFAQELERHRDDLAYRLGGVAA
ncbi:T3SS (YopN, CesT) and YbjN peptide-binding chaperone 1 [Dietzia sp. CH92]|uniref:T3SS (YopN, CesT) and YbjN peptide-binding chaperone 1 n=1 Tax=Dietzia sp. CH92 TaxID=3051823 RepID=UPI0028D6D96D|nr:YbjN domain-containing protein [Dietzia sp. CH92]